MSFVKHTAAGVLYQRHFTLSLMCFRLSSRPVPRRCCALATFVSYADCVCSVSLTHMLYGVDLLASVLSATADRQTGLVCGCQDSRPASLPSTLSGLSLAGLMPLGAADR